MSAPAGLPTRTSDARIAVVDCLRFVSICAVLAVHLGVAAITSPPALGWLAAAWQRFARNGSYGVTVFFVISGLVITRGILARFEEPGQIRPLWFYSRRFRRIVPLLLLTVAIGTLFVGWMPFEPGRRVEFCLRDPKAAFDGWLWAAIASFSFNWYRILQEPRAIGWGLHWDVLWSLAIEEQFYLAFPLVLRALASRRRITLFLGAVVGFGLLTRVAASVLWPRSFLIGFTQSFACFDQIAMGALVALALQGRGAPSRKWRVELGALGVVGLAIVAAAWGGPFLGRPDARAWGPSAVGGGTALFLYVAVRHRWLEGGLFRPFARLGELSYGAYLWHGLVLLLIWNLVDGWHVGVAYLAFLSATFALAAITHRLVEEPASRALKRWLDRRLERDPGPRVSRS